MSIKHPDSFARYATLGGLALAVAALATVGCGDAKSGLTTRAGGSAELVQADYKAPETIEPNEGETPYPLGLPSALKGRSTFQQNCASCHGTYLTGVEKVAMEKEASLPEAERKITHEVVKEGRQPGNPYWERKAGPDFYSRDWRFQRTPGELFRMIAYGRDRFGRQHPGPVFAADGRPVLDEAGKPKYEMGKGWMEHILDNRGGQLVSTGDTAPIWNTVYYAWSRSIAGVSPSRFTDVWNTYSQNCNVCHGAIGKGDGPLSRTLNPMPFNFHNRKALAEQTDEFLFWRISEGGQFTHIPEGVTKTMTPQALNLYVHQWSAMPSWKGVLTEDERWMAVDGVRSKTYEHE